jgi:hypothetical protein
MKHSFKKLVSLVLVLAISLAVSVPAFAATKDQGKEVKDSGQKVTEINTKTVSKVGEATYYFENTDAYRICIGSYPSGILDIAYLDKSNPDTIYVSNSKSNLYADGKSVQSEKKSSSIDFEQIKSKIIDKSIAMSEIPLDNFQSSTSLKKANVLRSGNSDAQIIGQALAKSYGNQYSSRLKRTLTESGKTANLYSSMYFNIYDGALTDFYFEIGKTLATAAVTLDLTVTVARSLLGSAVKLVKGEYQISRGVGVSKYYAEVIYYKDVRVGSDSPYRASREIDFTPYVCSAENSVILNKTNDFADSDFNDDRGLLEKGIELS